MILDFVIYSLILNYFLYFLIAMSFDEMVDKFAMFIRKKSMDSLLKLMQLPYVATAVFVIIVAYYFQYSISKFKNK
jgi:hypothetical protein